MENKTIHLTKEYVKITGEVLGRALNDDPISLYTFLWDEEIIPQFSKLSDRKE